MSVPAPSRRRGVLVVGVGGIGAPCAWALADAGVDRLVLVDPDRIESSNLPRQVLFGPADIGEWKADVAARRLARPGLDITARIARFDVSTADNLLRDVAVVVDATDGAATKDVVHGFSVAAGLPVIHAAAIGSEGRVLDVPAGGRPCLACLFGLLSSGDDGDTCARFGVFPGMVGAVGYLAAAAAIERLASPRAPSRGLRVLDLGAGRAVTLAATADPKCPVCGDGAQPRELLSARRGALSGAASVACAPLDVLDLRTESCPMNLLRARRAVDALSTGETLNIWLGEEGAATVPDGLESLGHEIAQREAVGAELRLRVRRRGSGPATGPANPDVGNEAWLRRYARQIVLPEVGEAGQRRWNDASLVVTGSGDAALACVVHLACAGVGTITVHDPEPIGDADRARWPFAEAVNARTRAAAVAEVMNARGHRVKIYEGGSPRGVRDDLIVAPEDGDWSGGTILPSDGPVGRALGALAADDAMRSLLGLRRDSPSIVIETNGTIWSDPVRSSKSPFTIPDRPHPSL